MGGFPVVAMLGEGLCAQLVDRPAKFEVFNRRCQRYDACLAAVLGRTEPLQGE